jgi:hypothetical protein
MLNVLIKKKHGNLILSNFFVNLSRILLLSKKKKKTIKIVYLPKKRAFILNQQILKIGHKLNL